MKKIIFLVLVFVSAKAFAQQDTTTVYARAGFEKDPVRANLIKSVVRNDSAWVLTLTDKKGTVYEKVSFADEKLEVRQGPYALYHKGKLAMEGNYRRGYEVGPWKSYHPNQKIDEMVNYIWGKRQGLYQSFWDNGQVKYEGNYEKGVKNGQWKLWNKDGKIASLVTFDNEGEETEAEYFDIDGKKIKQPVSYPGGIRAFYTYLSKEISYPKSAVENKVQGVVKVTFIVKKDGSIASIRVKESPSPELSKEAVRVISKSKGWIPGKVLDEPVDMRINIPVKFAL